MSLRRDAAQSLADTVGALVTLAKPPTVISAPPSESAEYPAMAILLDRFELYITQNEDLEVDENDTVLVGTDASLDNGVGVFQLGGGIFLSKIGTIRGHGRIWVASRTPAQREEIEDAVILAFMQDRSAPGRIMSTMKRPKVGGITLPVDWSVATIVASTEWTGEYVFAERLWSWIKFDMDVDMLVPRHDPIMTTPIIQLSQDLEFGTVQEQIQLDSTGNIVPYP